jgi:hypothetical protein
VTRPPLRHLILTQTGQDVRECQSCDQCSDWLADGMDLSFGEILRCAACDDPRALTCRSLWSCEPFLGRTGSCQAGLEIASIVAVLRGEAIRRGLGPRSPYPEWIL